jgi:hypothetical protein
MATIIKAVLTFLAEILLKAATPRCEDGRKAGALEARLKAKLKREGWKK